MSDWTPVVSVGDLVGTPNGVGKIKRIANNGDYAHVEVDGQLFEVQGNDLQKLDEPTPAPHGNQPEPGQQVYKIHNPKSKYIITDVVANTVLVKSLANGKRTRYSKRKFNQMFEREGVEPKAEEPKAEETATQQAAAEQKQDKLADDLLGLMNLQSKIERKVDESVDGQLADLRKAVEQSRVLEVKIGDKVSKVEGLKHKQLEQLINYAALRLSPLLVGMAGTGKTHAGEQVAQALGLSFYSISVGAQTTKTDIMGYMDANGNYIRTHFRDAYENGGVFLMDEIDAGNANVLITINAALSNGLAAFPDKMVKKHEDFVFIASANTFGNGANRQYVGRNQLDAATLDRFAIIEWLIDDDLEESLAVGLNGKAWYMAVRAARDYVAEKKIRALISPRATQKGSRLLDVGQDLEEVIHATMLGSVPDDKKRDVQDVATKIFEKFASKVPSTLDATVNPPTAADLVRDI